METNVNRARIKKLFSILIVLVVSLCNPLHIQAKPISLENAAVQAKKEGKVIFINFSGSDWCRSCILLKKTILDSPEFQEFARQHLVIVEADFPRQKKHQLTKEQRVYNENLAAKYNPKGEFPAIILLNSELKILGKTGYQKMSPDEYIRHLKSFIP